MSIRAHTLAWLLQKSAPMTVRYGNALQLAGQDLPAPTRLKVPTRHGAVPVWHYRGRVGAAVVLHFHGGAFMMRHPSMDDFFCRFLVAEAGVSVLNVDYSVAPQVRYPVAHEQAHDVAALVARHGAELGVDGSRLGLAGFSSGGNIAASVALQARDRGSFAPALQLLGVPSLDVAETYDQKRGGLNRPMLSPSVLDLVRATYFRDAVRRTEPYASPLRATDLAGLPPTYLVTAERDLLRAEGDRYAARLANAGVPLEHRVVRGQDHYFLDEHNLVQARGELDRMAAAVRRHLG